MLADDRIRRIWQTEFLQAGAACFRWKIRHLGDREKSVQNDVLEGRSIERRRDGLGKQARSA